jgi:hypothetical protein
LDVRAECGVVGLARVGISGIDGVVWLGRGGLVVELVGVGVVVRRGPGGVLVEMGVGDGVVAWVGRSGLVVVSDEDGEVEGDGSGVEVEDGEGGISGSGLLTGP